MDKRELRNKLLRESNAAGDPEFELNQLRRVQTGPEESDMYTLTVTCSEIATIICC